MRDDEPEPPDCQSCRGTGEGMTDGTICPACGGWGVDLNAKLEDSCDELERDDFNVA